MHPAASYNTAGCRLLLKADNLRYRTGADNLFNHFDAAEKASIASKSLERDATPPYTARSASAAESQGAIRLPWQLGA